MVTTLTFTWLVIHTIWLVVHSGILASGAAAQFSRPYLAKFFADIAVKLDPSLNADPVRPQGPTP